jgi:SH3-like domain-containing protein
MRLTRRAFCLTSACFALPVAAQTRGPVTGLPLPRFVSLKTSQANVRRGIDEHAQIHTLAQAVIG